MSLSYIKSFLNVYNVPLDDWLQDRQIILTTNVYFSWKILRKKILVEILGYKSRIKICV